MNIILIGVLGFVLFFLSDLFAVLKKKVIGYILVFLGTFAIAGSSVYILWTSKGYQTMYGMKFIMGPLTVIFFLLLIYSVLVEVNQTKTDNTLVTTGTYALSRHPGVLWFLLYYISGSVLFGSTEILLAGLVWSAVNIIYVILQEKLIFIKIFKGYDDYKKLTPMLLPTTKSIKRFIETTNGGHNENYTRHV